MKKVEQINMKIMFLNTVLLLKVRTQLMLKLKT